MSKSMGRSTITRRGFLASLIAAVPLLGVFIASERDTTSAQARPDTTRPIEKAKPEWHQSKDGNVRPEPASFALFRYKATRRVTLPASLEVTAKNLRRAGLKSIGNGIPAGLSLGQLGEVMYIERNDTITLKIRFQ